MHRALLGTTFIERIVGLIICIASMNIIFLPVLAAGTRDLLLPYNQAIVEGLGRQLTHIATSESCKPNVTDAFHSLPADTLELFIKTTLGVIIKVNKPSLFHLCLWKTTWDLLSVGFEKALLIRVLGLLD